MYMARKYTHVRYYAIARQSCLVFVRAPASFRDDLPREAWKWNAADVIQQLQFYASIIAAYVRRIRKKDTNFSPFFTSANSAT